MFSKKLGTANVDLMTELFCHSHTPSMGLAPSFSGGSFNEPCRRREY